MTTPTPAPPLTAVEREAIAARHAEDEEYIRCVDSRGETLKMDRSPHIDRARLLAALAAVQARLTTIIDEEYGLQPCADSVDDLLTSLERLAFERRLSDQKRESAALAAVEKERDEARAKLAQRNDQLVDMQRHRDAWRAYAYGTREKPSDFQDGNMVDRGPTRAERLEKALSAVAKHVPALMAPKDIAAFTTAYKAVNAAIAEATKGSV